MFEEVNNPDLLERAKRGEKAAFDTVVIANMGLVKAIAKHFRDRGTDFEDLVQIGSIGLMKAVKNFDITAGTRFSTYAVPLITGEIKKHLRDDGIIKVSRELKRESALVSKKRQEYIQENGEEPTISALALLCGISEEDVANACEATMPMLSFSEPEGDTTLENLIGTDNISAAVEKISLRQAMLCLAHDEREIIFNRYFLNKSQKETGEILGMTQVMISRKEKKIIKKMRQEML
ncbi:MAG: sigma-70 family RNA polymerase sigma factor [Eubacteriales bacterium]|nr:sigma-70 family RNA polymerase sigma factor [Eubacteriales bacterium]